MTITQEWEEYRRKVYPADAPEQQIWELRQTFFAGALVVEQAMLETGRLPDEEAAVAIRKIHTELWTENLARAEQFKNRN